MRKRGTLLPVRTPEQERLVYLADDMEQPLAQAAHLVRALEFVGYGLHSHGEDSANAVLGLATSMEDNLAIVQAAWRKMIAAI